MLVCEIDIFSTQTTPRVWSACQYQYLVTSPPALINATTFLSVPFLCDVLPPRILAADLSNPGTVPAPIRTTSREKAVKADGRLAIMD